ncbi:MAG: hypothetical protein H7Y38_18690 [Armatimonadetes bacterium]|nr:hypothetical protein [Armatimonadota bacterium]
MTQTIEGTVEEVIRELFVRRVPMGAKVSLSLEDAPEEVAMTDDPQAFLDELSNGVAVDVAPTTKYDREELYAEHN